MWGIVPLRNGQTWLWNVCLVFSLKKKSLPWQDGNHLFKKWFALIQQWLQNWTTELSLLCIMQLILIWEEVRSLASNKINEVKACLDFKGIDYSQNNLKMELLNIIYHVHHQQIYHFALSANWIYWQKKMGLKYAGCNHSTVN